MGNRNANATFICLILINVIIISGLFSIRIPILKMSDSQLSSYTDKEIAEKSIMKLRSSIVENKGQIADEEILFYGFLNNGKIAFARSKIMLWLKGMNSIIYLTFNGARSVSPIGVNELKTKSNFFYGNRGTTTNVKSFEGILYNNLWKGIDLYYQATLKGIKYEFRLSSGADPKDISIICKGHEQLNIGKDTLTIEKGDERFVDTGLFVCQEGVEIDARFVTKGNNAFGFQLGDYDHKKPIVIDPLIYSTYVGGSDYDVGNSIAIDNEGNAYVTGRTTSTNFPTTINAYNRTHGGTAIHGGEGDCFVFKLSADGSSLLYSTFVGGSSGDIGNSIALDNEGNAFVTGGTASRNFPTTLNAYNRTWSLGDCFAFKLSANGSALLYSTFVGGSNQDNGISITLDSEWNAYVTGYTYSIDFPTTTGVFDRTNDGYTDCFVFKLSGDGSSLLYSTYVGGTDFDRSHSITCDLDGNVYVTGYTGSSNFPTTTSAFDRTYGDYDDCFVFKLSADGSSLLYSTFLGESLRDKGESIAVDSGGNAVVTGSTSSRNFPTTVNAYNRTYGNYTDCFVTKLSADGSSLLYSTFIGGRNYDRGESIVIDSLGNVYVTGYTESNNFPTTENAFDRTNDGYPDCFVFKLSVDGSSLLYSTFVGGFSWSQGYCLAIDNEGNAYVTGYTDSDDYPTTVGAYDRSLNGADDCFVFKLLIEDVIPPTPSPTTSSKVGSEIWFTLPVFFICIITFVLNKKKKMRKYNSSF